ncbi:hypothetical protein [Symbiopectobacterium purcellii]|uniref:hypothetical protein n=1 Tax=Symbiopectobacterium purcellii TaxID=2871826 RepID=UPI003F872A92
MPRVYSSANFYITVLDKKFGKDNTLNDLTDKGLHVKGYVSNLLKVTNTSYNQKFGEKLLPRLLDNRISKFEFEEMRKLQKDIPSFQEVNSEDPNRS